MTAGENITSCHNRYSRQSFRYELSRALSLPDISKLEGWGSKIQYAFRFMFVRSIKKCWNIFEAPIKLRFFSFSFYETSNLNLHNST